MQDALAAGEAMMEWMRELFPLCRSLTGRGTQQTLAYIGERLPGLNILTFKTGEKVFDWTIPEQWEISDAYIEHESGRRFAEFSKSNLHVVNYSAPLDARLTREELLPMIWTEPGQPDRIPYVTSYYQRRSGFCMSQIEKDALPEGQYRALIHSSLAPGELKIGELVVRGLSEKEILFSTYICHPSMANNELSGPVLAMALARHLRDVVKSPNYTYRFLFLVETIGSIAYLWRHSEALKSSLLAGFVLSCVGDERAYSHVQSPYANTLADKALACALGGKENVKTYSFLMRGSDERQFCAPGIGLPVCGFCRSKYGEFPEYHTDADNLELVSASGLGGSFEVMRSIISAFEAGPYVAATVPCEPQLGKRGLYPNLSQKSSRDYPRLRMDLLAYADGTNSLFDICSLLGADLGAVTEEAALLSAHGLLEARPFPFP